MRGQKNTKLTKLRNCEGSRTRHQLPVKRNFATREWTYGVLFHTKRKFGLMHRIIQEPETSNFTDCGILNVSGTSERSRRYQRLALFVGVKNSKNRKYQLDNSKKVSVKNLSKTSRYSFVATCTSPTPVPAASTMTWEAVDGIYAGNKTLQFTPPAADTRLLDIYVDYRTVIKCLI